jgi:Rrf2 family protein
MATRPDAVHNALDLAAVTGLPAPTVSKILAALVRGGVLLSLRGAHGGYRLARSPQQISIADVIGALDGPVALTLCLEQGDGACDVEPLCPSRQGWRRINEALRGALEGVTLADMAFGALPPTAPLPAGAERDAGGQVH